MRIGKYETTLAAWKKRLYYHLHIKGWHENPRHSLYWPAEGWITDEQEIVNAFRLDDGWEVKKDSDDEVA